MRKNLLIFVCLLLASVASAQKVVNPRPFTIPAIHEWKGGTGHVEVNGQSRILVADTRLQKVAELLAEDLQTLTGQRLTVVAGSKAAGGDIVFSYKPQKALGDEGYTIDINKHVSIAATERGALYAVQTLLQIIEGNEKYKVKSEKSNNPSSIISQPSSLSFPKGKITDKPDYRLRGLTHSRN